MKQNIHHLYYLFRKFLDKNLANLFYPRGFVALSRSGWIIIALLFCNAVLVAQESNPEEFLIGAKLGAEVTYLDQTFDKYVECGFNSIWWEAYPTSKPYLDTFNNPLLAENGHSREDFVHHYATGYYSKWEAEQNQDDNKVGIKHVNGLECSWKGGECWSTRGVTAPACSLIYGPHYRQDKRYKRWLYQDPGWSRYNLDYNVRFRMALDYIQGTVSQDEDVCNIKVVLRFNKEYSDGSWDSPEDTVFMVKTLKVQDFLSGGEFKFISFDSTYRYPVRFRPPEIVSTDYLHKLEQPAPVVTNYNDTNPGEGIQFYVDWLRADTLCKLYIDNIEVYDNDGWNRFIDDPDGTTNLIKNYAATYQNVYPYIKYWYAHDEPYSIDAFIPYHTVEQIVMDTTGIPLITEFYPYWTYDGTINGEDFLQQWNDIGQPQKLMIDFYPFSPDYPFRFTDADELRKRLQKCSALQPGFWYSAQAFGTKINGIWNIWRRPDSTEFKTTIMLGLAHGMSGIMLYSFTSFTDGANSEALGIVDNRNLPIITTDLYDVLKKSLIPRLKGNLGKKLMNLNYTGSYLQLQRDDNQQSPPPPVSDEYLTLRSGSPEQLLLNWHCGFFNRPSYPLDKYFMLANLITTYDDRHIEVTIQPPVTGYENYRFRNIEGIFDTTFNDSGITKLVTHLSGEGYLYQVAPVVLYG
jgi:hypothetical protein